MKSYQRIIPILICIVLVLLFLPACTSPTSSQLPPTPEAAQTEEPVASPEPTQDQETVKLKVVTQPYITFVPFYMALQEGYFAEQGLDVELVTLTSNQEILPALSSGQVDVSSGLVSSGLLNAIGRGGNFKIVADKGYIDPDQCANYAMIARQDLVEAGVFQSEEDLRGHTIDTVPATWLEYYLGRLLEAGGLTLEDIDTTDMPPPAEKEAFEQKTLELTILSEPWVTRHMKAGHSPVLTPASELLPDSEAAVIMYGPTMLDEDTDIGERFMVAYLKGVRQYDEGKTPRNMELVAEYTQLDPELLAEMCWPALRRSGELNVQSILDFQEWAIDAGYLDEAVLPESFWDGSFVTNANSILDSAQ
jgi:NitT/TauT family transport system substrate-binding protein